MSVVMSHEQSAVPEEVSQRIFQYDLLGSKKYSPVAGVSPAGPVAVARRIGIAKSPGLVVYLKISAVVKLPSETTLSRTAYVLTPETYMPICIG